MSGDLFEKAHKDAARRWNDLRFLKWAEKTHPTIVSKLRQDYENSEGGEEE